MSKHRQLSPEKYIVTKARSLPVYKCYLTSQWEETKMANIIVMRQHVNGNFTVGVYLVDLMCLGVKDTFYLFNQTKEVVEEGLNMDKLFVEEADYDLVHNIIYAGHDFAMEFDIKPHKDFGITKFILEEDNEAIPVIEIAVGDDEGKPNLMVDSSYNYGPILRKLKQHAGEGNYTIYIDDGDDDDDEPGEDDFDDEHDGDEDDELSFDFNDASKMETAELEEILEEQSSTYSNGLIVSTELLFRQLDKTEGGVLEEYEILKKTKDYQLFDRKKEQCQKASDDSQKELNYLFPQLRALGTNENNLDDEALMKSCLNLLAKYRYDDTVAYMIVNSIPVLTILGYLNLLEDNFQKYPPSVQLFITAWAALRHELQDAVHGLIINAPNVEMAYPFNKLIHGMHHKQFWLIKAIDAIRRDDKEQVFYYHNLVRISGTGGAIKYLYAAQLDNWLKKRMGLPTDEHEDVDIKGL